ncbi:hypothetical protein J31TS4_06890 [Paenibacillus sp. J31TS4]|nr:hypothetical protein J31TS4_06890 [Paenibacillus sp. J31TS4]
MLALCLFLIIIPTVTHAEEKIPLYLDGKLLVPEVAPRLINENTMVPIRIISENLGAEVKWNQQELKVSIDKNNTHIDLWINKRNAQVGGKTVAMDAAPVLIAGNTLVPIRFVAETLGIKVDWDNDKRAVYVTTKPGGITPPTTPPSGGGTNPGAGGGIQLPGGSQTPPPTPSGPVIQSIKATGDEIVIQGSAALTASHFYLSSPERIVVDLPNNRLGQALNPKLGEVNGSGAIAKVRYSLYSDNPASVRVVIDLNSKVSYTVTENKTANQVIIKLKQTRYNVMIDAGHGDHDSGAVSLTGKYEKDFNLAMALKVKALLDKEPLINPILSRADDTFLELDERVAKANNAGVDVFVSIHGNKYTPNVTGTETYYWKEDSIQLANIMHRFVTQAAGLPDRKVRQNNFRVITKTNMPAVLLEIGYLSNSGDEAKMYSPAFQDRVAQGIVDGIKSFLKIQ